MKGMLAKVKGMWTDCDFDLLPFKESKDMFILGGVDDIITNLDGGLVAPRDFRRVVGGAEKLDVPRDDLLSARHPAPTSGRISELLQHR